MGRITDLSGTFRKLETVLSERLRAVRSPQNFSIRTDIGKLDLKCESDRLAIYTASAQLPIVRVDQHLLTQLLMGFVSATSLLESGGLKAPKSLVGQLDALFPLQTAHTLWSDRFRWRNGTPAPAHMV